MFKKQLLNRKVKSFSETNWYEWGRKHHVSDLKRIYVNVKTREKLPFFLHDCKNYSGSVLAIFIKDVTLDPQILCDKLNKIDWEELGFFSEGRFAFTQRSLENVNLPTDF